MTREGEVFPTSFSRLRCSTADSVLWRTRRKWLSEQSLRPGSPCPTSCPHLQGLLPLADLHKHGRLWPQTYHCWGSATSHCSEVASVRQICPYRVLVTGQRPAASLHSLQLQTLEGLLTFGRGQFFGCGCSYLCLADKDPSSKDFLWGGAGEWKPIMPALERD